MLGSVGECSRVQYTLITGSIQPSYTQEQKLSSEQITCTIITSIRKQSRLYLTIKDSVEVYNKVIKVNREKYSLQFVTEACLQINLHLTLPNFTCISLAVAYRML